MKGICLVWSGGRQISPGLPDDRSLKATSELKFRGPSLGKTLWRHVQSYCTHFLVFMVVVGYLSNTVLSTFVGKIIRVGTSKRKVFREFVDECDSSLMRTCLPKSNNFDRFAFTFPQSRSNKFLLSLLLCGTQFSPWLPRTVSQ